MTQAEIVNAVINGITAIGSIFVAALAIWGDLIRSWIVGPKLTLSLTTGKGSLLTDEGGAQRLYYSLDVVNQRQSAVAMNCQVRMKQLWRRLPNGEFTEVQPPYPFLMCWPPSEFTSATMTVRRDQRLDFGALDAGEGFRPIVRYRPIGYDEFVVRANETMRYGFEIVSDQFVSRSLEVFEVTWTGVYSTNPDEMQKNLQIRKVSE